MSFPNINSNYNQSCFIVKGQFSQFYLEDNFMISS